MSSLIRKAVMLLALTSISPFVANGQVAGQAAKTKTAANSIKIFTLRYTDAESAVGIVAKLNPDVRLSADIRTNSLIVSGSAEHMEIVEALLERLDRTGSEKAPDSVKQVRLFQIRSADVRNIEKALKLVLDRDLRYVVDSSKNAIVAHGTADQLKKLETAVQLLDQPGVARPSKPLKLRVIWLTSDGGEKAKPITADLKPIAASLGKIGIDDLKIVTQSLINVSEPNSDFSVRGFVGEENWTFEISGTRQGEESSPTRIDLQIDAIKDRKNPIQLGVALTLAPNQMGVLGVTQTGTSNSVFVVQLVEGL